MKSFSTSIVELREIEWQLPGMKSIELATLELRSLRTIHHQQKKMRECFVPIEYSFVFFNASCLIFPFSQSTMSAHDIDLTPRSIIHQVSTKSFGIFSDHAFENLSDWTFYQKKKRKEKDR